MDVVVAIKQVPASSAPMDGASGILDRTLTGGRMNPRDSYAIEAALEIAEATNGRVTAITMGPESAKDVLKTALSMGVSRAVHLCDKAFAGADVYATAFTLAQAIKILSDHCIVVCGQQTTDGDTAQVPFSLAEQLRIPAVGWIKSMRISSDQKLILQQELSGGTQQVEIAGPCVLAIGEHTNCPRIPTLKNQLSARRKMIEVLTVQDFPEKDPFYYGLKGSCTKVIDIQNVKQNQKNPVLHLSPEEAALKIQTLIAAGRSEHGTE